MPTDDLLGSALAYAGMGWRVIPVHPETKIPCNPVTLARLSEWQNLATTDGGTLKQWFGRTRAGIGIATGRASCLVVIDVDTKDGKNSEVAFGFLESTLGALPETLMSITPSGGRHYVFRYPTTVDTRIPSTTNLGKALFQGETHIDIRADGGQINVAPTHRDGVPYRWTSSFEETGLADLPSAWLDLMMGGRRPQPQGFGSVGKGARNDTLFRYLCSERGKGANDDTLLELAHAWNEQNCHPPLSEREVESTARSASRYPADTVKNWTEYGNGQRFVEKFRCEVRSTPEAGWMVWRGNHWGRDERDFDVTNRMATIAADIEREVASIPSGEETLRKAGRAWARKSEMRATIKNSIGLAAGDETIRARITDFDRDPFVFATQNAVVDLRTGGGRGYEPSDMITSLAPVAFEPGQGAPKWERFLDRTFAGEASLIQAIQIMSGYFLTGLTDEHRIWIAYGIGRNGKGVFWSVLRDLMGPYARTARRDTFINKQNDGIPNDLAALRRSSAVHEAAHAVLAVWFGGRVKWVEIEGIGDGECDYAALQYDFEDYTERAEACISCAGWLAELKALDDPARAAELRRTDEDLTTIIEKYGCYGCADELEEDFGDDGATLARILSTRPGATDAQAISCYRVYEAETDALLERDEIWTAIVAVADALFATGKLMASTVYKHLQEAAPNVICGAFAKRPTGPAQQCRLGTRTNSDEAGRADPNIRAGRQREAQRNPWP